MQKKSLHLFQMVALTIAVIIVDQLTKYFVKTDMQLGESIEVFGEYVKITSHRNSGAAWGILQGQMIFFYIITVIVIIILIYMFFKEARGKLVMQLGISLLIAGAIGNFIDRVLYQQVTDFIDVLLITYDFPIFNVADASLTIGVVLLVIQILFLEREKKDENIQN